MSEALWDLDSSASDQKVAENIKSGFIKLDDTFMTAGKTALDDRIPPGSPAAIWGAGVALSGSCALLSLYIPETSKLHIANTGDSRAVFGRWSPSSKTYTAEPLSKDHTGFNQDEVARINTDHPGEEGIIDPKSGRLFGMAVTRAFGDHRWKMTTEEIKGLQAKAWGTPPRPKYKTPPYMTAEPEVTSTAVKGGDFVILASDGLWDVISSEHAVDCVSQWLEVRKTGRAIRPPNPGTKFAVDESGYPSYKATPEYFVIDNSQNAAACLLKNALGGSREDLVQGLIQLPSPV